jgi:arsenical pump membrane protein
VRLAWVGAGLCALGATAVLTGVLSPADLVAIADRVWPILLFVVAITIVAELAAVAGVFDVTGALLARVARGRTWMLWLLVLAFAVVATAFLSLDTTAVLLTPVVIAVARAHRLDPVPFALITVVLANTASLVLPVSNLTNLLAADRSGSHDPWPFIALLGPSALVAIVVSAGVLTIWMLPRLPSRFPEATLPAVADAALLRVSALVVAALLPLLVIGLPPWLPAVGAAAVLVALFAWRAPRVLRPSLVPFPLLVFASGLFVVVGAATSLGVGAVAAWAAGEGETLTDLWRVAGAGAVAANLGNNLPAFLALESTADSPDRLAALLVGVNAGPLITPWASLATLLWHHRLTASGVVLPWSRFIAIGAVTAPLTVGAAVLPLVL